MGLFCVGSFRFNAMNGRCKPPQATRAGGTRRSSLLTTRNAQLLFSFCALCVSVVFSSSKETLKCLKRRDFAACALRGGRAGFRRGEP